MLVGRKYQNAPIVEALCEFQFSPAAAWDGTIPGLVYAQIKTTFSKRREGTFFAFNVAPGAEPHLQAGGRMLFLQEDEKAFVQVGTHLDLDYFLAQPGQIALDDALNWIDVAHTRIEDTFEACITERLRQIFKEE